jgi:type I restriction enzyme S subunit
MKLERFFEKFDQFAHAPDAVTKMRELVLQLAVQGRLVHQDINDEPAEEMLQRITSTAKSRRRGIDESDGIEEPFVIPENWAWVRLTLVLNKLTDGTHHSPPNKPSGDFMYVTAKNIKTDGVQLQDITYVSAEVHEEIFSRCDPSFGDVLYIKDGATTGVATINQLRAPFSMLSSVALLKPSSAILNSYLLWAMRSPFFYEETRGAMKGAAITRVTLSVMAASLLPLPPLAEQKRIVAKVEELMALCDRLEAQQKERENRHIELTRAAIARFDEAPTPANLNFLFHQLYSVSPTDLRKVILNLAVEGKLSLRDPADESVTYLLRHIERARSSVRARVYPAIEPSEAPFEIPTTWAWVRLGNIALNSDSGWSPQCDPQPREGDAWGVLKVSAVSWGRFLPEENKALPPELRPREECEVKAGDFLVSRANTEDLVARSVVVIDTPPHLMMSDKIVRFAFPDLIDKGFINLVNSASFAREYYSRNASGTSSSMKNVGRDVMSNLPIPLPPLPEQRRIVAKTDALFELLSAMEEMITSSGSMASDLSDAIVGELVKAGGK